MSSAAARNRAPRKRRKSGRAPAKKGGQGLTSWLVLLAVVAGGIGLYENRDSVMQTLKPHTGHDRREASARKAEKRPDTRSQREKAKAGDVGVAHAPVPPKPVGTAAVRTASVAPTATTATATGHERTGVAGPFYFCGTSGLDMCVASGDSFWYGKKRYVLADIVAPRIDNAGCAQERQKGFAAKVRLRALLNAGRFDLKPMPGADGDGQRVATRGGRSLGSLLVSEGLAKPRAVRSDVWCR